jgi:adenylate cyclase
MPKIVDRLLKPLPHITMRVSILSLFLSLTLIAFGTTLAFLYYKHHQITVNVSQEAIDAADETIVTEVADLIEETQKVVEISANLINDIAEISPDNEILRNYMLQTICYHKDIPYIFVGAENGNFLGAENLKISDKKYFIMDKHKELPKDAIYNWQTYKRTGQSVEALSYYLDKDFKIVAEEDLSSDGYDPRTRPWYISAKKIDRLHWSEIYNYFNTETLGISAAKPIKDAKGNFIAVFAADLSFEFLSKFLADKTIGKSGKAFILDKDDGQIILPEKDLRTSPAITDAVVEKTYKISLDTKEKHFSFKKAGVRYLAYIDVFSSSIATNWLLAIVTPFNDFFGDMQKAQMGALLIILLIWGLSSLAIIYFAKRLSRPIIELSEEVDQIKHLSLNSEKRIVSKIKEIIQMDASIYSMKLAFRSFVCYVPKAIVEQLLLKNKKIALGGEKKEITVVFSDITNFTSIIEDLPVEKITPLLEEYFDMLSKIMLQNQGTIDKYIGDGIMAFWGAPKDLPDHTSICAEAILLCHAFVNELNERRAKKSMPVFRTRFGIHTGNAIVGNIGTAERMNYTLMGDTVNTASRLQGINKIYKTGIIISDQVKQKLHPEFITRPLDVVEVKGKKQKIAIYELIGKTGSKPEIAPSPEKIRLAEKFSEAYQAFHANDLAKAKSLFTSLHQEFPDDGATALYLERLQNS